MGCDHAKSREPEAHITVKTSTPTAGRPTPHLKILILGDAAVGKTSLLLRLAEDKFGSSLGPEDSRKVNFQTQGRPVELEIWDTAGQERFRTITTSFYRESAGVMLAFDLSQPKSFSGLERWILEIEKYGTPQITKILVGTKSDLKRAIEFDEADQFAASKGMEYLETSAKDNVQVTQAFEMLARKILDSI